MFCFHFFFQWDECFLWACIHYSQAKLPELHIIDEAALFFQRGSSFNNVPPPHKLIWNSNCNLCSSLIPCLCTCLCNIRPLCSSSRLHSLHLLLSLSLSLSTVTWRRGTVLWARIAWWRSVTLGCRGRRRTGCTPPPLGVSGRSLSSGRPLRPSTLVGAVCQRDSAPHTAVASSSFLSLTPCLSLSLYLVVHAFLHYLFALSLSLSLSPPFFTPSIPLRFPPLIHPLNIVLSFLHSCPLPCSSIYICLHSP